MATDHINRAETDLSTGLDSCTLFTDSEALSEIKNILNGDKNFLANEVSFAPQNLQFVHLQKYSIKEFSTPICNRYVCNIGSFDAAANGCMA
ncbi:hypothetical protein [Gordoniibacillus kamchatkensis]|uniref:hypothetical protein n=1 Tax=Gordoniibacillus kamchatkensis TaxID=1590651 RepID=UPI0018CEE939|nr:hypothetical protein [Paenibacillus sp. VKM B-2647]